MSTIIASFDDVIDADFKVLTNSLQVPPPQKAPVDYPGQLKQIERQHNPSFYNPGMGAGPQGMGAGPPGPGGPGQYPGSQNFLPGHHPHMNYNMPHVSSNLYVSRYS